MSRSQNPLDEAPLSMLQETEAILKAQLAAENVDDMISNPPPATSDKNSGPLASGAKISYNLMTNSEQIQYSITSGAFHIAKKKKKNAFLSYVTYGFHKTGLRIFISKWSLFECITLLTFQVFCKI